MKMEKITKKIISKKAKDSVLDYIQYLKQDGLPVDRAFIYGSYAKGKTHKWSDIDVCIISSKFQKKVDPLEYLWVKKRDKDIEAMISPIGFHPRDFVDESPLAWEVKKTGVRVI